MAYKQAPINFGVGTGSSPLSKTNKPPKKDKWENPDVDIPKGTNRNVSKHPLQGERPELSDTKVGESGKHTSVNPDVHARSPRPEPGPHTPSEGTDESTRPEKSADMIRKEKEQDEPGPGPGPNSPFPFKGWFKKWKENRKHKKFLKSQHESKVRRRDKR
jgi:hypothetical protein